uniref:Cytochrome c oxidase subunit 3 n=1 Tax=Southwellina hispida TaxID=449650 RepID=A0A0C4MW49_9BILA|nr:cytochrome c oxidase subunit III [Southwellina hispida]AIO11166.1 cytochrome c oxidase subunit 3 [Southwellina hispida]
MYMLVVSLWPLFVACSFYLIIMGLCLGVKLVLGVGFVMFGVGLFMWGSEDDVKMMVSEMYSDYMSGCGLGVLIFIFSEFMFFLSLLVSSVYLVEEWDSLVSVDMYGVPMLISFILLSSGVTLTKGHQMMYLGCNGSSFKWVVITVLLGLFFVAIQAGEWMENSFEMFDGVGGSLFYFVTGFHGLHVIMGVLLNISLGYMLFVLLSGGGLILWKMEGIVWYWHFVDVVWLFVYLGLYWYCM